MPHRINIMLIATALATTLATVGCGSVSVSTSSTVNSPSSPTQDTPQRSAYWTEPSNGSKDTLGVFTLPVNGTPVTLLQPTIKSPSGSLVVSSTKWNSTGDQLQITYTVGQSTLNAFLKISTTSAGMSVQITADQNLISSVDFGSWVSQLGATPIAVPYYTNSIAYSPVLSKFLNAWWDWHSSNATRMKRTSVGYEGKTDGTLNTLNETLQVAVSADVDQVLPSTGNPASPYLSKLAGRPVIDIWDGGFEFIRMNLSRLADYGITNCVAIVHNWQHAGYDNALPEHFDANPNLGGSEGLKSVIDQGASMGCLMAVHENYVDYYSNYPQFNPSAVSSGSDAGMIKAWQNPLGVQSYATKPSWMVANAETQSPNIKSTYGTTATFLDVHSSIPVSQYVDMDAKSPGAGTFAAWMSGNQALWSYERSVYKGPVLGEGYHHWFYSGLLDGVEAQFGAGDVPQNADSSAPLFVDFDLLKIHPLQANHGMGYYSRWTSSQSANMTTAQMDAYRTQEIAFGHQPYLGSPIWYNIADALIESDLVGPVAAEYGTSQLSSTSYLVNGTWSTASVAARAGSFQQVQVQYQNGLTVVANTAPSTLTWNQISIPQFGWAAKSNDLTAYSALCGSAYCDFAETPTMLFANARNQDDIRSAGGIAQPSVQSVKLNADGNTALTLNWKVLENPGQTDYLAFVHIVDDKQVTASNGGIVAQADHSLPIPSSLWVPGQMVFDGPTLFKIPTSVPDGTYSIRLGLWDPKTGRRANLYGIDDGTGRYEVGMLQISNGGTKVAFVALPPLPADPRLNAAGSLLDFGDVQTDGMISLTKVDGKWVLRPFPRYREFTVLLKTSRFPQPSSIDATDGPEGIVVPIPKGDYWALPINGSKSYSWAAN